MGTLRVLGWYDTVVCVLMIGFVFHGPRGILLLMADRWEAVGTCGWRWAGVGVRQLVERKSDLPLSVSVVSLVL